MRKSLLILVSLWLVGFSVQPVTTYKTHLPVASTRRADYGVNVYRNLYTAAPWLEMYGGQYARYSFGTGSTPGLYTTYLQSGWPGLAQFGQDIEAIKAQGVIPVVIIFGKTGGVCGKPSAYQAFANFTRDLITNYDLDYVEIWNEADLAGGNGNIYGCWGTAYTAQYVTLLSTVENTVKPIHPDVKIGVSYAATSSGFLPMAEASSPYVDFIGVHHYPVYNQSDPYPLSSIVSGVRSFWQGPLYVTEFNGRTPGSCTLPAFQTWQTAQAVDSLDAADLTFIHDLEQIGESWQCVGILEDATNLPGPVFEAISPFDWPYPAP